MIEELNYKDKIPYEVGAVIPTSYKDEHVVHSREILRIQDNVVTILYHAVPSQVEVDENGEELPVSQPRTVVVERYDLDGIYIDWYGIDPAQSAADERITEDLGNLFGEVIKKDELSEREAEEQERIAAAVRKSTTILPQVNNAISRELEYQSQKWGYDKEQSLPGYLLIMQQELKEAIDGWMINDRRDRNSTLEEVLQVVATGIRCLNDYGVKGNALSTSDVPETKSLEQYIIDTRAKYEAERYKRSNSLFGGAPMVSSFDQFLKPEPALEHVYIDSPVGGRQIPSTDVPFVQVTQDKEV